MKRFLSLVLAVVLFVRQRKALDPEVAVDARLHGEAASRPVERDAEEILQLLTQINREKGTAIVMVTHNRSICTRYPGRVFETRDETCREITL